MRHVVPQEKYDTDYFVHNCDGFTVDGSLCRRLKTLLCHIQLFSQKKADLLLLDVGCGRGEVAKYCRENNISCVSTDYSHAAFELFRKNNPNEPFILHDLSKGFQWVAENYFDVVVMADIVEHLFPEHITQTCSDMVRATKKGGIILIDTPIMDGGESELHVNIYSSAKEVHALFPGTDMVGTNWYKKPEHCNIILRKNG